MIAAPDFQLRARAELELRRRQRGETASRPAAWTMATFPGYGDWLAVARPRFDWNAPHFRLMQRVLDRVTAGELRRVIFQIPIRHGKSEHNTIGYSAYRIERDPHTRVLMGSYNVTQAQEFSRQTRRLVRARGLELERDAAGHWETAQGGGVRAVGAGAGVASVNADLIDIDDPFGSRQEAESPAHREAVHRWFTDDILARTEPHTAVLLTASRWHQDDLVGRLLDRQADLWELVDLPGRAEENDPLGRAPGEPLWPAFRGDAWLTEKRVEFGEYGFASLIQGRPRPREGGMFKWAWWCLIDEAPATGQLVRYWDPAGTDATGSNDPDYTCGALLGRMPDKRTVVVDVERFRKSVAARDARILEVAAADKKAYGGRVRWWFEKEAGIAGEERTNELIRRVQNLGISCQTERPTGSKQIRAEPFASKAEAGNVCLFTGGRDANGRPRNAWIDPFRLEAADFPGGTHDDQVDAAVGADAKLSVPAVTATSIPSPFG